MRVGRRLFPYPTLNQSPLLNTFKKSKFIFNVDIINDDENVILNNACYELNNQTLTKLIDEGKVEVCCIVECSFTIFRKKILLTNTPQNILIPLKDLRGKVVLSCFAYAIENIIGYNDDDFHEDYFSNSFDIEKYDILAADDGFDYSIQYDETEDNKASSIFLIIKDENIKDELMKVDYQLGNRRKIVIKLPESQFNIYDRMKHAEIYYNIFFSMFVIPALSYVFTKIQNNEVDILRNEYTWFESVFNAYQKLYGRQMTNEDLTSLNALELAQELMNKASIKAINDFFDITMNGGGGNIYE